MYRLKLNLRISPSAQRSREEAGRGGGRARGAEPAAAAAARRAEPPTRAERSHRRRERSRPEGRSQAHADPKFQTPAGMTCRARRVEPARPTRRIG